MLLGLLLLPLLWEGSLSQNLEVQPSVIVQEGLCAWIPCTFSYDLGPIYNSYRAYGFWFRDGTNTNTDSPVATNHPLREVEWGAKGRFRLLGDPGRKNCSLSISDSQATDSGRYFFRFEQGREKYNFRYPQLSVKVTDLSQEPNISVPELLEAGTPVTLNCTFAWTCWDQRTLRFSWRGAALSSPQDTSGPSPSSEVSFTPGQQHHGTPLTCQVTLPGGRLSAQRTIFLNVSYAVQNMTITLSQGNRTTVWVPGISSPLVAQEGESLHLLCAANSNPPAILSWMLGDQILVSQPSEDGVLHLQLPQLKPADGGRYTCLAQHPLGPKQVSLDISVQYPPKMLNVSCSWVDDVLFCNCFIQAEPMPYLHWFVGNKVVEDNSSNNSFCLISNKTQSGVNGSLSMKLKGVPNITVTCQGKNKHGTQTFVFQLVPDRTTVTHLFQKGIITGIFSGAGITVLLTLCLLLLVKVFRKKSVATAAAPRGRTEDAKAPSWMNQSLDPIPPAAETVPTPAAPEDGLDELHYACLNFEGVKAREQNQSTDLISEYSEIKFQ